MDRQTRLKELTNSWMQLLREGKPTFDIKKKIQLIHLEAAEAMPYLMEIRVAVANDCCTECRPFRDSIWDIENAKNTMPIPHPACTHQGGCRCRYIAIARRDDKGKLILKNK